MLYYPKIPGSQQAPLGRCLAFEKYDGTNLHWAWDRDFGWHAFGTRRDEYNLTTAGIQQFAAKHAHLRQCVEVFQVDFAEQLQSVLRKHTRYQQAEGIKVFTEFLGPNSFAGLHREEDPKELRIIDVWLEPGGFVSPWQFVDDFGGLNIARVVYEGKLTGKFAEDVRTGKYRVAEGVVCKGVAGADLWMVKIKTYAYKQRLQQAFADRWEDHWE